MTKGKLAFTALSNWCKANGYPLPVPEHPLTKSIGRKHRADAAWPELSIGLDIAIA